jgi:hypothetical protein
VQCIHLSEWDTGSAPPTPSALMAHFVPLTEMWFCSEMKYSQTLQQISNVPSSKVQLPGLHPPWCWHQQRSRSMARGARARVYCSHHTRVALITYVLLSSQSDVLLSAHTRGHEGHAGWFEWRPCLQNLNMLEIITNKQTTHKHESNSNKFVFLPVL